MEDFKYLKALQRPGWRCCSAFRVLLLVCQSFSRSVSPAFFCDYPPICDTRPIIVQGFSGAFYKFPLMRLFSINPLADTDPVIAIVDHFVECVLPYKEMPGRAPDYTGVVGTPRFKVSCQKDKTEARRERRAEFNSAPTSGSKRLDLVVGGV